MIILTLLQYRHNIISLLYISFFILLIICCFLHYEPICTYNLKKWKRYYLWEKFIHPYFLEKDKYSMCHILFLLLFRFIVGFILWNFLPLSSKIKKVSFSSLNGKKSNFFTYIFFLISMDSLHIYCIYGGAVYFSILKTLPVCYLNFFWVYFFLFQRRKKYCYFYQFWQYPIRCHLNLLNSRKNPNKNKR